MTRRDGERPDPRLVRTPDELVVDDSTWVTLGQLRALVVLADERRWPSNALVSTGPGREHPRRHDVLICRRLVIEGHEPEPEAGA